MEPGEFRPLEVFEPVTLRAYSRKGGNLLYEVYIEQEVQYQHLLAGCQELLNKGFCSRVDVVKGTGTDLIGSLTARSSYQMEMGKHA